MKLNQRQKSNYQGLQSIPVLINDTSERSDSYFVLSDIPTKLTSGKNYIKIAGSSNLVPNSEIKIEILDRNGKPISYEVLKGLDTVQRATIVINVYPDTPLGYASITLLGIARTDISNWREKPNVKWSKNIIVVPEERNISDITFRSGSDYQPTFNVVEIYKNYTDTKQTSDSIISQSFNRTTNGLGLNYYLNYNALQQNINQSSYNDTRRIRFNNKTLSGPTQLYIPSNLTAYQEQGNNLVRLSLDCQTHTDTFKIYNDNDLTSWVRKVNFVNVSNSNTDTGKLYLSFYSESAFNNKATKVIVNFFKDSNKTQLVAQTSNSYVRGNISTHGNDYIYGANVVETSGSGLYGYVEYSFTSSSNNQYIGSPQTSSEMVPLLTNYYVNTNKLPFAFTKDMVGGIIKIPTPQTVQPIDGEQFIDIDPIYTCSIVDVINSKTVIVDSPYFRRYTLNGITTTKVYTSFDYSGFEIQYKNPEIELDSEAKKTYLLVDGQNIKPETGEINKVRLSYRPKNETEYKTLEDKIVSIQDNLLFETSSVALEPIGIIHNRGDIDRYWAWTSESISEGNVNVQYNNDVVYNSIKITYSGSDNTTDNLYRVYTKPEYNIPVYKNNSYFLNLDIVANRQNNRQSYVSVYCTGSSIISDDSYGKLLGRIDIGSNFTASYYDLNLNIIPDFIGNIQFIFLVKNSDCYISDIRLKSNAQTSLAPSHVRLVYPIETTFPSESVDLKIDLLNFNDQTSKQYYTINNFIINHAKVHYIQGPDNIISGSVTVGSKVNEGIEIVSSPSGSYVRTAGYESGSLTGFMFYSGSVPGMPTNSGSGYISPNFTTNENYTQIGQTIIVSGSSISGSSTPPSPFFWYNSSSIDIHSTGSVWLSGSNKQLAINVSPTNLPNSESALYVNAFGKYGGYFVSNNNIGVYGAGLNYGLFGFSDGYGVYGSSSYGYGVYGKSDLVYGVYGIGNNDAGVVGSSTNGSGVKAVTQNGTGIYVTSVSGSIAEFYSGNPAVNKLTILNNGVLESYTTISAQYFVANKGVINFPTESSAEYNITGSLSFRGERLWFTNRYGHVNDLVSSAWYNWYTSESNISMTFNNVAFTSIVSSSVGIYRAHYGGTTYLGTPGSITNGKITIAPGSYGYYMLNIKASITDTVATSVSSFIVLKNGSEVANLINSTDHSAASYGSSLSVSGILKIADSDYIEVKYKNTNGGGLRTVTIKYFDISLHKIYNSIV